MYYKFFVVIILVINLNGCGDDDDGNNNNAKIIALDLDGTWNSNCYFDEVDVYKTEKFVFSGNSFETSYVRWRDSTCSGNLIESASGTGAFTAGETVTTTSGIDAVEVDFKGTFYIRKFKVLDIIRKDGDEFNYGVFIDDNTRPTEIDLNISFTRQQI